MRLVLLFSTALMMILSCGGAQPDETETAVATELPEHTLTVTDSIGIEMGDSVYVFGAVMDGEILPDGNIMILDGISCNIRIYSPAGEHVRTISGRGSGPGELLNPFDIFNWGNGEFSVNDVYAGGIHRFTTDGEWLGLDLPITHNAFINPIVTGIDRFVSFKSVFTQEDDAIYATAFVALYNMTIDAEVTYWEKTMPWDPSNMGNLALEAIFSNYYTANPATGMVYVSPFHGDGYEIQTFNADGTSAGVITAEYTPVPKTPEEIQTEKDFIEFFLRNAESNNPNLNYECDPWPNHFAVAGLHIGPNGNLWAMRGGTDIPTFDIWGEDHQLLGTATIPGLSGSDSSWKFVFGREHSLAWSENPDDYQKIYILTMD